MNRLKYLRFLFVLFVVLTVFFGILLFVEDVTFARLRHHWLLFVHPAVWNHARTWKHGGVRFLHDGHRKLHARLRDEP